jgi:hypothetical protein
MASKIELKSLFASLQNQMTVQLNTNREFIEHPGSKGDSLESTWIGWLRKYLPNRYCIDKAIIIDHEGHLSHQIDLVIYDQQYTPFVFTQNGIHYIPAEGVYAVFEVKPDLNGSADVEGKSVSYIEYASAKINSVRKLKRTTTYIIDRGRMHDPRALTKIIGGILTNTNTIKKEETLEKKLAKTVGLGSIDMGCIADGGSFIVDYEGEENPNILDFNQRFLDYYSKRTIRKIKISEKENSMITFFLQLSRYLQQSIGTVAAIDLNAYAKEVGFDLDSEI